MRAATSLAIIRAMAMAGFAFSAPSIAAASQGQGAWSTGQYRNLFAERGHSSTEIDAKIDDAFRQIFFGDSATQSVYRVQSDTSLALVESDGYATSPDMGAAMLISVMMDRQDVFQKLWKFAKEQMQNTIGERQGYFCWMVEATPPYASVDLNPSPDGEETIATALLLAARRWETDADRSGYQKAADSILDAMVRGDRGERMQPLVDSIRKQIVFTPAQAEEAYTAPAFHMPAFYRVWAAFASRNADLWREMADTTYAFWKRAEHPTTGLFPSLAIFDGTPKVAKIFPQLDDTGALRYADTTFASAAYRAAANISLDWDWFRADEWAVEHTRKQLGFFAQQAGAPKSQFALSGAVLDTSTSSGLVACNAAAAAASDRATDGRFVDDLWNASIPSGADRFPNGLIHLLSLLQVSGKFIAYGAPGGVIGVQEGRSLRKSFSVRQTGQRLQVEGVEGTVRLLDPRGRESARARSTGSVTLAATGPGLWIVDAGLGGVRKVVVAR
jgi:oligosaccharide reducing-end xylanase